MRSWLVILVAMFLLPACGTVSDLPSIFLEDNYFTPVLDSLTAGSNDSLTVVFRWGNTSNNHTITWDDGPGILPEDSPSVSAGSFQVVLIPGTYNYHCAIHDAAYGMRGTIVVSPFTAAHAF